MGWSNIKSWKSSFPPAAATTWSTCAHLTRVLEASTVKWPTAPSTATRCLRWVSSLLCLSLYHLFCFLLTPSLSSRLQKVVPMIGYMEILEISASVLGLLFLVAIFICVRKRYVQQKKKKPVCVQDSNGWEQCFLFQCLSTSWFQWKRWNHFLLTLPSQLLPAQFGQKSEGRQPGAQPHRDELTGRSHQRPGPHPLQVSTATQPDLSVRTRGFLCEGAGAGRVQRGPQPARQAAVQLRQRLHQEEPLGHGLWRWLLDDHHGDKCFNNTVKQCCSRDVH